MGKPRAKPISKIFACDFETTVYDGQDHTEVWAAACAEVNTKNEALVFGNIGDQLNYFNRLNCDIVAYYHNLKFDGSFWLNFLIREGYKQAYEDYSDDNFFVEFINPKNMPPKSFNYSISAEGMWYKIVIKLFSGKTIEIRDSLKLIPFALREIGKAFNTEHRKLDMEYKGFRYANCYISPKEMEYIKNDVYVLREALEFMFGRNETKLTIGSCCLSEFKDIMASKHPKRFKTLFPLLDERHGKNGEVYNTLDSNEYGSSTYDEYIRKSYRGGWCYLVKERANKLIKFRRPNSDGTKITGTTADVNSLYPSMMHSESGNYYPCGAPTFWKGDIPEFLLRPDSYKYYYFFVRVRTRFKLKEGFLPTIQIKGSLYYRGTDMLETSDYIDKEGKVHRYGKFIEKDGTVYNGRLKPTMTLTQTDWKLINDHYVLEDCEILDGCYFHAEKGMFDEYIDKWKKIKTESEGSMRTLAKLFLNNLYGKFSTSSNGDFKVAYLGEEGELKFRNVRDVEKDTVYIPVGSAITSYARNFTIRAAQANYHGKDKPGFIYADTDSIHCDLLPNEIVGINVHPTNFCCWALESCWDEAIFVRQKTYIEHVTHKDEKAINKPYYDVKCAGMPKKCKDQFVYSITQDIPDEFYDKATTEMIEFVEKKRELTDFKVGLRISGKLKPKQIKGGVILEDTMFEIRQHTLVN